jgi:hypothetical protein
MQLYGLDLFEEVAAFDSGIRVSLLPAARSWMSDFSLGLEVRFYYPGEAAESGA